jgi:hypothetical protein
MKSLLVMAALAAALCCQGAMAAIVKIATVAGVTLQNSSGTALEGGAINDGDGTLIEVGYYSLATTLSPFAGTWIPLTGPNSGSMIVTTMGDGFSGADGTFTFSFELSDSLANLPGEGTPLSLRFYDTRTLGLSSRFNAVSQSGGAWNWVGAAQITMLLEVSPDLVWQDGPGSAFRTTIPVPEPSACLLGGLFALGAMGRRRRYHR